MLDFTDKKQEKDFTRMKRSKKTSVILQRIKWLFAIAVLLSGFQFSSCKDSNTVTENIPKGLVNLTLDLNLPSYQHLQQVGTHAYVPGGVKGVLIIHDYDDAWYAYERACAFEPTKNCSNIWVDSINIQLMCGTYSGTTFQSCCESKYMYSGFPLKGPAAGRLAQYYISRNNNILQVYN
jgi:hypothetical protein